MQLARTSPLARLLLPAIAVLLVARAARAQQAGPPWAAAVDSMMRAELARAKAPGAQIAIAQGGRIVYTRGYGVADVETGRLVTERTLFQVGSIAKMVTGAMLAQLAAEGTVDLQAPISRYVPELAGRRVGTATIHQLLTNSAGWVEWANPFGTADESALGRAMTAVTDTLILLEPGRVYSYSNPGFSMAGYVAERAAKAPFADLAERLVLRKVGMPHATFRRTSATASDFAQGHMPDASGAMVVQRPMPGNAAESPAGFLWTSAAELARFGATLMAGGTLDGERALSADAVRAMTTGYIRVPTAPRTWSGYGMHVDTVAGRRFWRKAGSVRGYFSELMMWPDLQLAVVVSINGLDEMPTRASMLAAQLATGLRLEREPAPAEPPATAEDRRQILGRYVERIGAPAAEVVEVDGRLEWRGERNTLPLRMVSASRLVAEPPGKPPRPLLVLRDGDGRVRYLYIVNKVYVKQP